MPSRQLSPVLARFYQLLSQLRQEKGLSLEKLSKKAGISRGTLRRIEKGLANPNLTTANRIARALGWDLGDLMARAEREANNPQ